MSIIQNALLLWSKVDKPEGVPKVELNSTQIGNIVSGILLVAAVVCVVFIIIGGIEYVISQGDSSKIKKAKDSILYAVIGLVIVGLAFAVVQFVVGIFK